jgi:hypothetical protein
MIGKTHYNYNYKFLQSKKSSEALPHNRKSEYFRTKMSNSKSNKRKSPSKNSANCEYSFNLDDFLNGQYSPTIKKKSKGKLNLNNSTSKHKQLDDPVLRTILKKEPKKYKLSEFDVLALLGYGTFGSVLLVKYLNELNPYALKIVK